MKVTNYGSFAVFAFLYSSEVSAVQLRDIFDAYDDEALIEANSTDDQIDPAQLTAEIGGEDIAREVKGATAGVGQDTTMIQLESDVEYPQHKKIAAHKRRIIDEDGDGVEDNVKKDQYELDRFRHPIFGVPIEDMHNTHNGEMPGHVRFGDSPEPGTDPWAIARAKEAKEAEKKADKQKEIAQLKADLKASEQNVQLESEFKPRTKQAPRKIIDADGDGVEDNRAVARHWLDKFHNDVYGSQIDDIHNTHNGELPGHERHSEDPAPGEKWVQTPETKTKFLLQLKDNLGVRFEDQALQTQLDSRSENEGDSEMLQTSSSWKPRTKQAPRRIIDADGDGVEDNRAIARHWLDKFHNDVYGSQIDDIHNTHNGELPGHERHGEDPAPGEKWVQTPETETKFLLQLKNQELLFTMSNKIDSPEALEDTNLLEFRPFKAWKITDADGDGVEDNVHRTFWELDRFNKPNNFFPLEDLHNTHHGNLPGHVQREWDEKQHAPEDTYTITKRNWNRYGN